MPTPLDELTPDESLRADNQIKLLKLELNHNIVFEEFGEAESPQVVGEFLDSIIALEEMHKNPQPITVYDKIKRPAYQPETDLTDAEVSAALRLLIRQMGNHGVALEVLAPDDYDDRTIYRFITTELFYHETSNIGSGWTTNFTYEEFHPNHRYDIVGHCEDFISHLIEDRFEYLEYCLDRRFFIPESDLYQVVIRPEVEAALLDLLDRWWPYSIRGSSASVIQISDDLQTAQVALHLELAVENDPNTKTETGLVWLRQSYDCWSIGRVEFDDWKLA